jgi:asparagine synthase (glutamine-hydrolysing)
MKQQLPGEIVWRKDKVGFEPPQQQWMEHPQLIERIQESKRKLVNNGILDKMVLTKPIRPRPANAGDNYDFRYLIAGLCLEPSRFITSMFM